MARVGIRGHIGSQEGEAKKITDTIQVTKEGVTEERDRMGWGVLRQWG